jgi:hypothetical protein
MQQAVETMRRTSQAAAEFPKASGAELRISLREPFEKLRLSNSVTATNY